MSRQNVMQAVEDLQYNLSTHCTGMATVITPLIYAELNFVIRRILMHPEVLQQIVPQGGTWWRVVETLQHGHEERAAALDGALQQGEAGRRHHLRQIADYNPSTFENDAIFSAFISNVDAFITTQSILQEALDRRPQRSRTTATERPCREPTGERPDTMPPPRRRAAAAAARRRASDEWAF